MRTNAFSNDGAEAGVASVFNSQERVPSLQQAAPAPSVVMLGIPFDNVTQEQAVERIVAMIESRRPQYVVTANVDFLVQAREDWELRRILTEAHMVLCDGTPLVWASRVLGNPLPERVAGADVVPQLIAIAAQRQFRLFFLGATPEANDCAVANIRARHPGILIAGHYSPPFRPLAEMDNAEIMRRVREARPDLLLVAFGCPKAEKWIARHYQTLGVPVMIGVGATIDFLAGRVKRAPPWMQRGGVEWFFRLCQEPNRLFRRYAKDLWFFAGGMTGQWWRTGFRIARSYRPSRHCVATDDGDWMRIQSPVVFDRESVKLGEWIWRQAARCHCLLDLRRTRFIDSTGVGLLLRLRRELHASNKQLLLLSPNLVVRRLLESMGLEDHFVTAAGSDDLSKLTASDQTEFGAGSISHCRESQLSEANFGNTRGAKFEVALPGVAR
jgi:exopolysaccharide biosynthesis WecB/TagA/CpsF family protein/anti-anti-sigma factor